MKISIIGTGTVGQTLAAKFLEVGHDVMVGTRNVSEKLKSTEKDGYGNSPFSDWYKANNKVKLGSFAEAAAFGEIIVNATHGENSISALKLADTRNFAGKILIDISNPLDFSKGMPASLLPGLNNTNSLGEEIQRTFPESKVVKTLNTMWCGLMVNPGMLAGGDHINYISGNDYDAKGKVRKLLTEIGWHEENLFDLGDITAARATEALLPIWLKVMGIMKTGAFNFKLVRN
jgi:8-hydroxy-5-deazaflavin:NADPH oxidoreductase